MKQQRLKVREKYVPDVTFRTNQSERAAVFAKRSVCQDRGVNFFRLAKTFPI